MSGKESGGLPNSDQCAKARHGLPRWHTRRELVFAASMMVTAGPLTEVTVTSFVSLRQTEGAA